MPVPGTKPKAEAEKRNRVRPVHDWLEVTDLPYDGRRPGLPSVMTIVNRRGELVEVPTHKLTKAWWRSASRMPHCVLWSQSDWQFALATAVVANQAFLGSTAAAGELRQREKILGTTVDARRDLRIRYVDPEEVSLPATGTDGAPAPVAHLDARRARLTAAEDSAGDDAP